MFKFIDLFVVYCINRVVSTEKRFRCVPPGYVIDHGIVAGTFIAYSTPCGLWRYFDTLFITH